MCASCMWKLASEDGNRQRNLKTNARTYLQAVKQAEGERKERGGFSLEDIRMIRIYLAATAVAVFAAAALAAGAGAILELRGGGGSLVGSNKISTFIGLAVDARRWVHRERVSAQAIRRKRRAPSPVIEMDKERTAIDESSIVLSESHLRIARSSEFDGSDTSRLAMLVVGQRDPRHWSDGLREEVLWCCNGDLGVGGPGKVRVPGGGRAGTGGNGGTGQSRKESVSQVAATTKARQKGRAPKEGRAK